MSYRIVISSFAAVAIGMSCIATDASARGGGGGGGGGFGRGGGFGGGGFHSAAIGGGGFRSGVTGPTGGGGYFAAPGVRRIPRITGVGPAPSNPRHFYRLTGVGDPTAGGAAGATGGGVAAGVLYYAPASYDSNAACGRYPYPPCNKVPTR